MDSLSVEMEVWMTQPPRVCSTSLNSSCVPVHKHTQAEKEKHSMHAHPQMFQCVQRSDSTHWCTMAHTLTHTHTHTHTNTWTCRLEADVARVNGRMFLNGPRFLLIYKTFLCLCLTFLIRHYLDRNRFPKNSQTQRMLCIPRSHAAAGQHILTPNLSNEAAWSVALRFRPWHSTYPSNVSLAPAHHNNTYAKSG